MKLPTVKVWLLLATLSLILSGLTLVLVTAAALQPTPEELPPGSGAVRQPQITDRHGIPLSFTYQNDWNVHNLVVLHAIPDLLQVAFVESEDQRFYRHHGVDWLARFHALAQNLLAMRAVRGASTISEQVVRILHPRQRTLWARWLEGFEAARLERRFSKPEILEFYLNQVPYARQRRGVAQAALDYFDRDLDTLSVKEMLALAVLVRSPSRLDLIRSTELIRQPIESLSERLNAKGLLPQEEVMVIKRAPLILVRPKSPVEAAHFVRFIRSRLPAGSSARVVSTLDGVLQNQVQMILDRQVQSLSTRHVAHGAVLVVDHDSDEILAWVNAGGFSLQEGAQIDKVTTPRQPGSTLKPFVYAMTLEQGWTPATLIDDSPFAEAVGHGLHNYRNYSRQYYGPLRLREALANSLNVPAVKAVNLTGRSEFLHRLRKLGFDHLSKHPDYYGDGLVLGNGEVTLLSLVQAYAALARGGVLRSLRYLHEWQNPEPPVRVFSSEISSLIAHILSDPEARALEFGRNSVLALPLPAAVKTGTSNDYRDAWAVGFSHRFTVGVWMGNLGGQPMREVTGSLGPALVMRSTFAELHRNLEPRPLYLSRKLTRHSICRVSGKSPTNTCPTVTEWFRPGNQPNDVCPLHEASTVAEAQPVVGSLGRVRIQSPTPGLHLAMDPRIPDELEYFPFRLAPVPTQSRVEWILDDQVLASTSGQKPSYLWRVSRGSHELRARLWRDNSDRPVETEPVIFLVK